MNGKMKLFCAAVAAVLLAACSQSGSISEKDVNDMLAKTDKAIAAKNADEFGTLLSDSVKINVSISQNGKVQNLSFDKRGYVDLLKEGFSTSQDYQYERTNMKISISGNTATVTNDLRETMTTQGQRTTTNSKETTVLVREQGKLVISRMDSSTSM